MAKRSADNHRHRTGRAERARKVSATELVEQMALAPVPKAGPPDVQVDEASGPIDLWIGLGNRIQRLEAEQSAAAAEIIRIGSPARIDLCRSLGRVVPTVRLNGRLSLTQNSRYAAIGAEELPRLVEAFDRAAEYFARERSIALTEEAARDPEILEALVHALGPEKFRKSFRVTDAIAVSSTFHEDFTLDPGVSQRATPFIQDQTIRPYKPSLRA